MRKKLLYKELSLVVLILLLVIFLMPNLVQATKNTEKSNSEYYPFKELIQNSSPNYMTSESNLSQQVIENIRKETIEKAGKMLLEIPVTVTSASCKRSTGGRHDFYSEGDYWWPDPANPNGAYIQKDGQTNP